MNNLKEKREKLNISQTALASSVGVSARHIAFIESGDRKPSIDLAFKIAEQLKCRVEDIFLTEECTESTIVKEAKK